MTGFHTSFCSEGEPNGMEAIRSFRYKGVRAFLD